MAVSYLGTYSPFEPLSEQAMLSLGSMEGLDYAPKKKSVWRANTPGYAMAAGIAAAAFGVHAVPALRPVSASIIAIVLAVLLRNLFTVPPNVLAGCKHVVRNVIPVAIVCAGAGISLTRVAGVGWRSLVITMVCMALALASAVLASRWLGLSRRTGILLGAGTAICGTSAIVAVAPLIEAEDEDVTLSVGTVSLLGLILMFALPLAGRLLGMGQDAFGVWAGTSIHAVPQVLAAGFTYGPEAGTLATLVKLARVTLLAPFMLLLTLVLRADRVSTQYARLIPPFVWGFLTLAVLNTLGLLPVLGFPSTGVLSSLSVRLGTWLVEAGNWLLTLAMAAIGLEVNLRLLVRVGGRALLAGFMAVVVLCLASLGLIRAIL